MQTDLLETNDKFRIILKNFLDADCNIHEEYTTKLITHLSSKNIEKDYNYLLCSPDTVKWIHEYLSKFSIETKKFNRNIASFMLHLSALINPESLLLSDSELCLADKIILFLKEHKENLSPSMKLGHVHFMSSIIKHNVGLQWIKTNESWHDILDYCTKCSTIYVVREAMKLLYTILHTFLVNSNEEEISVQILSEIVKPLTENVFNEVTVTVYVDDMNLQRTLSPMLKLICFILEKIVESEVQSKIPHYLNVMNFKINLWKLANMTQNEQFLGEVLKTHTYFNYAILVHEKWKGDNIASADFNEFGVAFFNQMKFCILRKSGHNVLILAELNHNLWKKLGSRVPEEILIESERIQFENQVILFHLLPVIFIFKSQIKNNEELIDEYLMKLFSISCGFTLRVCYAFRDYLFECPLDSVSDVAYKSIYGILSMKNQLHKDRAVLVFQAMIYLLKEYIPEVDDSLYDEHVYSDTNLLVKTPNLLSAVLIGLYTLIQNYRITWKESIESTCLLNFMIVLLRNSNLTARLAIQCIKLTQLSIEHFLSPNMALLIDNLNGSGMQFIGPMILKRLHDISWEVRDSTLELVSAISSISLLKFPAFQEYLLHNKICPTIFSIAQNDSESYVRASALKCLLQMSMINLIWDKCLCDYNIVEHLLNTLPNESESIVRKESVALITQIHHLRKVPDAYENLLFSTMAHCAINDLHWEVKINALHFWKIVICQEFTNQGMIDGIFPNVTFSKEKKKIVTLNDKEITIRIEKILHKLSQEGCLGVILQCLKDDCDLSVVIMAVKIVKKLLEYLNKYDFLEAIETDKQMNNKTKYLNFDTNMEKIDEQIISSNSYFVVESIVSSDDINLLSKIYSNEMETDANVTKINEIFYKTFSSTNPNSFLKEVKTMNLDSIIKEKADWINKSESLNSLLEDMISIIRNLDLHSDCY